MGHAVSLAQHPKLMSPLIFRDPASMLELALAEDLL